MPVDQYNDTSFKELYSLINAFPEAEEHIKTASLDWETNDSRPDTAFAWREQRMFPIDSPQEAALSRLYMEKQAGVPDVVIARCEKALKLYGVNMSLQEKQASAPDPDEYLLPKIKRFRVVDSESVKLASEALIQNRRKLDVETCAEASIRLTKRATAMGEVLPTSVYKMAGLTVSHTPSMGDWLEARAAAATDPAISGAYQKLAEATRTREEYVYDRDELVKVADVIGKLDERSGLTKYYGTTLPDPIETVFNTDKIAEDTLDLAGTPVPMSTLLSVDPETYNDVFGEDLAQEFVGPDGQIDETQLSLLLPTVPLDLQQALAAQIGV